MDKGEMLSNMLVLATNGHAGQFDKSGTPYILHPLKVMYLLKTDDVELMCIALGHDIIEDTKTTYHDLRAAGMTERVIQGIRALTKIPGETYDEYKVKVKSNIDAVRVKMADLRHNSDLRRLKGITMKDLERAKRYIEFYKELEDIMKEFERG